MAELTKKVMIFWEQSYVGGVETQAVEMLETGHPAKVRAGEERLPFFQPGVASEIHSYDEIGLIEWTFHPLNQRKDICKVQACLTFSGHCQDSYSGRGRDWSDYTEHLITSVT